MHLLKGWWHELSQAGAYLRGGGYRVVKPWGAVSPQLHPGQHPSVRVVCPPAPPLGKLPVAVEEKRSFPLALGEGCQGVPGWLWKPDLPTILLMGRSGATLLRPTH